jgi:hypothetical protein
MKQVCSAPCHKKSWIPVLIFSWAKFGDFIGTSRRKRRLIEDDTKCLHLNCDLERDFAAALYMTEARSLLGFALGCSSNFVCSDSWQKYIECRSPTVYSLQHNPIPPPPYHILYISTYTWKGEGQCLTREKGRRATGENIDQKAASKIPTWLNVCKKQSPVYKLSVFLTGVNAVCISLNNLYVFP